MFKRLLYRYRYRQEYRRNQKAAKKRLKDHNESIRRNIKSEFRQERNEKIKSFIKDPFAAKQLSEEEQLLQNLKLEAGIHRKERRRKWFSRFRKNPFRAIFFREKLEDEIQLMEWRKADRKLAARQRFRNNFEALREIMKTRDLRRRFGAGMVQSTMFYVLSFLLVYILYQLVTIAVSRGFNIPTIWYYYRVKFPLFTGSHLYTRIALIGIFISGPLFSLILSFVFLGQFFNRKLKSQNLKLFLLWSFIHGTNLFFGSYIVGFITRTEFIYASEWIFMSSMFDVEEIIFTIVAISISIIIGRLVTPLFLLCSGSVQLVESRYRLMYVITHILLPWFFGAIVFWALTSPIYYIPFTLKTITPLISLLPALFTYNSARNNNIPVNAVFRKAYFKWSLVIAVIALLFFYRIILNFGLKFF